MNRPAQGRQSDEIVVQAPDERRKFDSLFAESRHYRGDCRLARTAIRRGWIKPEDRDAFVDRLNELHGPHYNRARPLDFNWRRIRGSVYLLLEMGWSNEREERYANPFGWPERTSGRPRRCWYVSDHPERLDAHRVRLELLRCSDPWGVDSITLTHGVSDGPHRTDHVRLAREGNRERRALRVFLICPHCAAWRRFLYLTKSGVGCRACMDLRYARADRRGASVSEQHIDAGKNPPLDPNREG